MINNIGKLVHLLRNVSVREIVNAIEQDGFILKRTTRTGGHIYAHNDQRRVVIHYHRGSDTLTRKTLYNILEVIGWAEEDLKKIK
ncbi:type II toxin-antitoxin system HicA family toxin, partial [Patescibacteria group bacterium]|nr:type II toxin-antitoxin system HicA family toxin [Patescibacteria group bacterium]